PQHALHTRRLGGLTPRRWPWGTFSSLGRYPLVNICPCTLFGGLTWTVAGFSLQPPMEAGCPETSAAASRASGALLVRGKCTNRPTPCLASNRLLVRSSKVCLVFSPWITPKSCWISSRKQPIIVLGTFWRWLSFATTSILWLAFPTIPSQSSFWAPSKVTTVVL